ncbi:phosphoribosylamine--glycine ligase [Salana multivorans]
MKILLIGSGAREHALARSLAEAGADLVIAPGNPGTAALGENRDVVATDPVAVAALADEVGAELVVVGPEAPLVAGVADAVRAAGTPVFGPDAAAAHLEGSKAFAKEIMAAAQVPTALAHVCDTLAEVEAAIDAFGAPYVIKDDGLAAGKGVVVTSDRAEALAHAEACLAKAGGTVVVEEFLDGPEVSLFCLSDGRTVVPLAPAQDFKRIGEGDTGLNTGGMGAYSPLDWAPAGLVDEVVERVAQPTIDELARRGTPFVGLLYCGLALTSRGLRVIEFNARFGDPETQVVLARLRTPLDEVLLAAATGRLEDVSLVWDEGVAVTVVVAAPGYPESPSLGGVLTGVDVHAEKDGAAPVDSLPGVWVLHAGTARGDSGELVSSGGRVLSVVGTGATLAEARVATYQGVDRIRLDGARIRRDIALAAERGEVTVPE